MEFFIHTTRLTQEEVKQSLDAFLKQGNGTDFVLEDSTSLRIFPANRIFRKIKGAFNPHDNVENAWFLVNALLQLSLLDQDACISVFDLSVENDREDFFALHAPQHEQQQKQHSKVRHFIFQGRVVWLADSVDELSAVLRCRTLGSTGVLPLELDPLPAKANLSLPQRVKLCGIPKRLIGAIQSVPELIPLACLVECGKEAIALAQTLMRENAGEVVDCIVKTSRFSYSVLQHKANSQRETKTELIMQGLASLILQNDEYEQDKARALELDWFSIKPLRSMFTMPEKQLEAITLPEKREKEEEDDDAWMESDDSEEENESSAWTELEKELNNTAEFDGVIHESDTKPVEFSSQELFRILQL